MKMWKVDNDEENNDKQRTFFSDKPFKFGSGELIIKATDAIRAVTGPNMQKYQIQMCQNSDTHVHPTFRGINRFE